MAKMIYIAASLFVALSAPSAAALASGGQTVASPDGKTVLTVSDLNGTPTYSVAYDGVTMIENSPLGMVTNIGDFTKGLSITFSTPVKQVADDYSLPNIKKSRVNYRANRGVFTFGKDGKNVFDYIVEVSDNNVAFRYLLHPQGDTRCCVVESEATGFAMPAGTTTFLCPQSLPMGGFARTAPSYETSYTLDDSTGKNGWGAGYSFPCLFRNGDKGWMLISETGIAGDYCASHLAGNTNGSYTIAYPQQGEMNGFGSASAAISLPGYTPWRTITVGSDLKPIMETTIPFDVVRPLYNPSRKYEYGKGSWSWIMKMDPSCNFDEQKRYIDFSSDMGYSSVLVDALWDTQIGYDGIEKLAEYGKRKGVDLFLWYNSNGSWNDAPQGPRGIMNDIVKRRKDMAWMKKNGIKGIKVDFFGGDKQEMMRLYHDILADANDYGLLVIFHGCTLPRGWDRMYPNFVASEAVLASENLHFSQGSCDAEAMNATIHPFIRNTVGGMDFGGSALNKYYNAGNEPKGSKRKTSDVFALAAAVLFQSPVQHFALAPNNLQDAPSWAIGFMKNVPTVWDETRFIDGYPGKYVVMARRKGYDWYVCGVNAGPKAVDVAFSLPEGMTGKNLSLYSDDAALNGSVKDFKAVKGGNAKVSIPSNGGFVIAAKPAKPNRPIIQTSYTADPAPMVHDGTVYLYTSHDEDDADGFKMYDWLLYTSTDMVNWTAHGAVASLKDFKWNKRENGAWAIQVVERNGKFYMYCPIHGNGIGVLVADSPYGPFVDPIGKPLVWQKEHWNDIDPTVLVDDDGQAYLYWGNPHLYGVKLNDDMVSYSGDIITYPHIQDYQEGPWLSKHDGRYYMSFASTCCPEGIGYAMSDSASGPWEYKGHIMDHTPRTRGNHPGLIDYKGKSYVFGHSYDVLRRETPDHHERRNVEAAEMWYNADGTIQEVPYFRDATLSQIEALNPFKRVEAETMAWGYGLKTLPAPDNGPATANNMVVAGIDPGEYIEISGVDFKKGAGEFTVMASGMEKGGTIEIRLDSPSGKKIGELKIVPTGGIDSYRTFKTRLEKVAGVHDLFLCFEGEGKDLFRLDWWKMK